MLLVVAAPSTALADGFVVADYSGTWDEAFVYQPKDPAVWQESMHFVWDERETARVAGGTSSSFATVKVLSRTLTITGTKTVTFAPPNQQGDCTATFSVRPGGRFPLTILAGSTGNPLINVSAIAPLAGVYSQLGGTGHCTYAANGSAGAAGSVPTRFYTVPLTPLFVFKLARRSYVKSYNTLDVNPDGTKQVSVSALFRAATNPNRVPSLPGPTPLATPVRDAAKRNALAALKVTVRAALYPCGVGVGVGFTLLAAGPAGGAAGLGLLATGAPLCAAMLRTIIDEEASYKDPPRSDYWRIARVATFKPLRRSGGCARWAGSLKAFCRRVAASASSVLDAFRHTEAVARAIEVTIGRDTAAASAHVQAAVDLQEQALRQLAAQFTAAVHAQSTAAAGLQSVLRGRGVSLRISVAQFRRDASALLSKAARRGLSARRLEKLAKAALRPVRFDPIAAL